MPARKRLSRAESQAHTRQRILDSARQLFAEKGFVGASVEEIAERAGYSKGAFYSNFEDKDEVLLTLLDQRDERQFDEVEKLLMSATTTDEFFDLFRSRTRDRADRRMWLMLSLEFTLYALRNPSVLPKLAEFENYEVVMYKAAIEFLHASLDIPLPAPSDQIGTIIRALERGLDIHEQLVDAPEPGRDFVDAVTLLFRASAALAAQADD